MTTVPSQLFIDRLWPRRAGAGEILRQAVIIGLASGLLWASAKISVPFWPVPMTLQTAAVFLIGVTCGARLGFLAVLAYLAEGAAGLPVFAGTPERGLGLAYMAGPTGGYLLAFPFAAWMAGLAAERRLSWPAMGATLLLATAVIYLLGVSWLATFVGMARAVEVGVLPFVLGDLVKLALVLAIYELGLGKDRSRSG